jgi:hypothetical protein
LVVVVGVNIARLAAACSVAVVRIIIIIILIILIIITEWMICNEITTK